MRAGRGCGMSAPPLPRGITPQRIRILALAAQGYTSAQIGQRLGMRGSTVQNRLRDVYAALGARDRTHAVVLAIRYGWIDPGQVEPMPRPGSTAA